ncbi:VOC family protein [Hazenella sp. IB182357]|uniref:VOC family protein n=1 Tax=Polycladospora coralii TaxID=2771432 RepID=A0A926RY35_9BACL|nr:VOC family protein [Polycladospora coralii]MBS7531684.1 VOC family protein [Polycladospora coralii]
MSNQKIVPYFMFNGLAEEAMQFYMDAFGDGEVMGLMRYQDEEANLDFPIPPGYERKVLHAQFRIHDQILYCSDAVGKDGGNISLTIECQSEEEIKRLLERLSQGGEIQMPLQDVFWGAQFAVLKDKFSIHWQLNFQNENDL